MTNIIDYTATEARANLFEILNSVYFGEKEVRIIKNKKPMVRIIKEIKITDKKSDLFELVGSLSDSNALSIKKEIKKLKKLPPRNIF
jgi:prevent-host-death family protein